MNKQFLWQDAKRAWAIFFTAVISVIVIDLNSSDVFAEGTAPVLTQFEITANTDDGILQWEDGIYYAENLKEKDETVYSDTIEALISRAQIPIKAVLGNSSISVDDFINLQVGDIIRLDRGVDEDLNIYVGNIKKFAALPGATGNNYAVRITSVIREDE